MKKSLYKGVAASIGKKPRTNGYTRDQMFKQNNGSTITIFPLKNCWTNLFMFILVYCGMPFYFIYFLLKKNHKNSIDLHSNEQIIDLRKECSPLA